MPSTTDAGTADRRAGRGPRTLGARVDGSVVVPGDADWDDARRAWNLAVDQRPVAVVSAACAADVIVVVEHARAHGLRVTAQGTGHGASSLPSLDGTILVKTSRLRAVEIDAGARRVRVGAGACWRDVAEPAAAHGFVVLHGSSPDVGVTGYVLGGGLGWLARSRGLAAHSVTAVEIVTADGRLVWADHETESELFWAVRGGGGNFGIVTAIELELIPTPELYGGAMFWPVTRAAEVLRAWRAWCDTVPDEITSIGRIVHFPALTDIPAALRGASFVIVEAVFTGPERAGAELLAGLRALGPCMDTFAPIVPAALHDLHMDPPTPVPAIGDGILLEQLAPETIDVVVATAVAPLVTLEIRQLGGALAAASDSHGAVGAIDARFAAFAAGLAPTPPLRAEVSAAVDRATAALGPWASARAYFNFSERPIDTARLYPPSTYERLRRIRTLYDPGELFVANHPIPTSARGPREHADTRPGRTDERANR